MITDNDSIKLERYLAQHTDAIDVVDMKESR